MAQWILPSDDLWTLTLADTEHDFYHLPCYVELASQLDQGEPRAFYKELATGRLLIPLLVRNVPSNICPNCGFRDATSPYGFPGPLFSKNISFHDAAKGVKDFIEFGREVGLVTTFLRLHPFLSDKIWSAFSHDRQNVKIFSRGSTVSIDLTLATKELDSRLRRNHRQNIRRLNKMGFSATIDDWKTFGEFIEIYHQTMRRCGAKDYYYFDQEYFLRLRKCLGTTLHICTVKSPEGDVASGGLVVKTGNVVQAHLSATAEKYLFLSPSKLMFYAARNWAKSAGAKVFHLGGGVGGGDDSLFSFKRGLGTHEHQFKTIGIIHDLSAYDRVYESWVHTHKYEACSESVFFPFYRYSALERMNRLKVR
jgi:hypothetical protein